MERIRDALPPPEPQRAHCQPQAPALLLLPLLLRGLLPPLRAELP
jgi:hypothetical protein